MPDYPPYPCLGSEMAGAAEIFEDGVKINTLNASRCFLDWYCPANGYTWAWRSGIDPDDPTTWPPPYVPEEPEGPA